MSTETSPRDELQTMWMQTGGASESSTKPAVSFAALERDAKRYKRTVAFRDARELSAALLMIPFFAWKAFAAHNTVELAGDLGCVVVGLWVGMVLWIRRPRHQPAMTDALDAHLGWYRRALESQGRLLRAAWAWYVSPIAVSVLMSFVGGALARGKWGAFESGYMGAVLAGSVFLSLLNRRAGRELLALAAAL